MCTSSIAPVDVAWWRSDRPFHGQRSFLQHYLPGGCVIVGWTSSVCKCGDSVGLRFCCRAYMSADNGALGNMRANSKRTAGPISTDSSTKELQGRAKYLSFMSALLTGRLALGIARQADEETGTGLSPKRTGRHITCGCSALTWMLSQLEPSSLMSRW